jgi:hypothetical protein
LRGRCLPPWAVESGLAGQIVGVGNNHPVAITVWALVLGTRRQPRAVTPVAFDHRSQSIRVLPTEMRHGEFPVIGVHRTPRIAGPNVANDRR